jgi:cell wall-associated NlpC family hydrolase
LQNLVGDETAGEKLVSQSGYRVGETQSATDSLVKAGVDPLRDMLKAGNNTDLSALRSRKTGEQGYARTIMQGLVKERSAAGQELEQGIIDTQTNLYQQGQEFNQQQQYNAALNQFYNSSIANFSGGGGGQGILSAAQRYLGVPYKWGGESTSGFDCSGLVQQVFRDNGINLPRTSREQFAATSAVSGGLRAAQPGDLLFWGSPVHHVAIYMGNGMMIAAPHSGALVQVQRVYGNPMVHRA